MPRVWRVLRAEVLIPGQAAHVAVRAKVYRVAVQPVPVFQDLHQVLLAERIVVVALKLRLVQAQARAHVALMTIATLLHRVVTRQAAVALAPVAALTVAVAALLLVPVAVAVLAAAPAEEADDK